MLLIYFCSVDSIKNVEPFDKLRANGEKENSEESAVRAELVEA
jgi:hypothetical protein